MNRTGNEKFIPTYHMTVQEFGYHLILYFRCQVGQGLL